MTQQPEQHGREPAQTTDRLRHDINHGLTGEKASYNDPSAAPLGTDDEAGGHTTPAHLVEQASRAEYNPGKETPGVTKERGRFVSGDLDTHNRNLVGTVIGVILVIAALAIIALFVVT